MPSRTIPVFDLAENIDELAAGLDPPPSNRLPGRPYFDRAGAEHLAAVLRDERQHDLRAAANAGVIGLDEAIERARRNLGEPATSPRDDARAAIDELDDKIVTTGSLYGPGVAAAILGYPDNHLQTIRHAVHDLATALDRADDKSDRDDDEIARLEHELARAQCAHDEELRLARLGANADAHRRYVERYTEQLEHAVHHLAERWSKGTARRVLDRAWRRTVELGPKDAETVEADG